MHATAEDTSEYLDEDVPSPSLLYPSFSERDSYQKDELKMKDHLPDKDFEDLLTLVQQKHTLIDKEMLKADIAEDYQLKQLLSEVEGILKTAALANQREHKSIVVKHNLISQGFGNSQTIKERLTSLAEKQRMLLTCFKRQTELKEKMKSLNAKALTSSISENGEKVIAVTQPTLTNKIHSDLAQPVPLDRLIKENILKPNESVSCSLMGCEFEACLLSDGQLKVSNGMCYSNTQLWLNACWAVLGHQRKVTKKQAYKIVLYKDQPLISYCEQYSLKQVSSYLITKHQTTSALLSNPQVHTCPKSFNLYHLLHNSHIVSQQQPNPNTSLPITEDMWGNSAFKISHDVWQKIRCDLKWT